MAQPIDFTNFVVAFEASGLEYCLTGSVASGIYGEPRGTVDIDFVLLMRIEDISKLRAVFPDNRYYVPPDEMLHGEIRRGARAMFNLIWHEGMLKADVFLAVRDPLHHWALEHRRRDEFAPGVPVWIAPPEYVIIRKLEYFREGGSDKHTRDIRFMLACTEVDRVFLDEQIARLGLAPQWAETTRPR